MPRCQGWSEDYDSDSWPISDVRLHARSLKISCHPCSAIPVVCTPVQSFTYLTDLYSSMLNWGEGNGNPLQYSCLENPRDRGAWWAPIYGVAQSRTWLKWLSSSSMLNWVRRAIGSTMNPVHSQQSANIPPRLLCDNECSLLPARGHQVQTAKGETGITWFFRLLPSLTLTVFLLLAPKNWINATVKRAREQENELKRIYTIRLLSKRKMEKTENVVVTREGLGPVCEGRRQKSLPLSSSFQSCL